MSSKTGVPVVGLLYPGIGAEDDFPALERRLGGRVQLPLVHTSVGQDAHTVDALLDLGSSARLARGAAELAQLEPDAVMWACTSGSFVFGWEGAQRQIDELAAQIGRPASSTSIAFVDAARSLGLGRVAVAASYPEKVARAFEDFLRRGKLRVTAVASHEIFTAAAVGTLGPDDVLGLVASVDRTGADAVLVPDTAMHTMALIDRLESELTVPVLTANQVTIWQGLRLAMGNEPLPDLSDAGLGSLFRHPATGSAAPPSRSERHGPESIGDKLDGGKLDGDKTVRRVR